MRDSHDRALYPDMAILHVHCADIYGNCQVDGITIADCDVAHTSKRVIISTEQLVDTDEIRKDPTNTLLPYWLGDAVCQVRYGSNPGNMPYEYYSDEAHLAEWMKAEREPARLEAHLDKYIFKTACLEEYLELNGGTKRIAELYELEPLRRTAGER